MTTSTVSNLNSGQFQVRMPISALTHFIGFIAALLGTPVLLIRASLNDASLSELICFTIFMFGMMLMYSASTAYHTFNLSEIGNRRLKKFDHMMIPIMIAGSYTPICQLVLEKPSGTILLAIIWSLAAAGIVALENNVERLETDHKNALYLAKEINEHPVKVDLATVQTNIINADISSTGLSSFQIKNDLEEAGLRLNAISDEKIRLVTHKDISETEIKKSVHILKNYFDIP